jgi:hypothetical protein
MNLLPQNIKNLISEFNAEHREKMGVVLHELYERENLCWYCDNYCDRNSKNNRVIKKIMFQKYTFCCSRCATDGEELIREQL